MTGNAIAHVGTEVRRLEYLLRQAEVLSRSSLVPKHLRGKPEDVYNVISTGDDFGAVPSAALGLIYVIEGTVVMAAQFQMGLARHAGHDIWLEHSDENSATYCGRRRGSKHVERITWTIEQAKRANLTGKPNWKSYPEAMLRARAGANLVRVLCPDVLMGLRAETPDELGVEEFVDGEVIEGPELASPVSDGGPIAGPEETTESGGDEVPSVASDTPKPGAADGTFTAEDEKFAGAEFGKRYTQAARTAGLNEPEIEALVSHATGGRTTNPANVYAGREAKLLGQWFVAVRDDEYGFITGNDGSIRVVKVVSHAGENVGQPGEDDDA